MQRKFIYVIFTFLVTLSSQSKDMPEPGVYYASSPPPPVGLPLPIDDHLPLLLLAGLIYGAIKSCERKKINVD